LHGPDEETIAQIVHLSIRFGIVTPYTSYLVTEELFLGERAQEQIVEKQFSELQAMPEAPVSGQEAVQRAADQGALAGAESVEAPAHEAADLVRHVGSRTFIFKDSVWVDTAFDPEKMGTTRVEFLSDDYFRLVAAYPELGPAFALGPQVIAFAGQSIYQVLPAGESGDALPALPAPPADEATEPDPVELVEATAVVPPTQGQPELAQGGEDTRTEPGSNPAVRCLSGLLPLSAGLVMIAVCSSRKRSAH
jgi:Ca-activated chloride channel homolog